jgi:uncharacterized protein YbjT (DUF2867 family)
MSGGKVRVLVLGGYGFIGAEIARVLIREGHEVVGLGRSAPTGARLVPEAKWIGVDMARLLREQDWATHLGGVDAIVNAAGALQDGPRDNLEAIHYRAVVALVAAAARAGVRRIVQISAPGAEGDASTAFMRTKAAGDAAVRASALDWTILKPGLVIGRGAYGGTALLRMLAGFPLATPLVHASARVQTVALDDVAAAVVAVLKGEVASRRDYDLVEDAPHTLRDVVRAFRRQLGFAPARVEPYLPAWIAAPASALGDLAGAFGWRSPFRSTAMKVMSEDVVADPAPWREAGGRRLNSLEETLRDLPGTAQERLFARAQLALPLMIVALALFWIASGAIGWIGVEAGAAMLPSFGPFWSKAAVIGGAVADVAIGALILNRATSRAALVASVALAGFYLIMGTLLAPHLWADPLGVYVKVIPAMALGVAAALILEPR